MKFKILFTKGLLCSNVYIVTFFKILSNNGLSTEEILLGISAGTVSMVFGDLLSSFFVDRFGPKRIVILGGLLQGLSVSLIPFCDHLSALIGTEILIGLSFPVIYGADSKWLKYVSVNWNSLEKWNQNTTWVSQIISIGLGTLLIPFGSVSCFFSAGLYLTGVGLAFFLPDIKTEKMVKTKRDLKTFLNRVQMVLVLGVLLGFVQASSWLFQYQTFESLGKNNFVFAVAQFLGAAASLAGGFLVLTLSRVRRMGLFLFIILSFAMIFSMKFSALSWSLLVALLFLRGTINIESRKAVLTNLEAHEPVAFLSSILTSFSKVTQSVVLWIFSLIAH